MYVSKKCLSSIYVTRLTFHHLLHIIYHYFFLIYFLKQTQNLRHRNNAICVNLIQIFPCTVIMQDNIRSDSLFISTFKSTAYSLNPSPLLIHQKLSENGSKETQGCVRECHLGTCRKSKHIVIGVEAYEIQRITFTYLLKSICPYCAHLFKRQIMNDISQRVIPVITRTG